MNKKCGGLFKEFVKAIVKHTIVFIGAINLDGVR